MHGVRVFFFFMGALCLSGISCLPERTAASGSGDAAPPKAVRVGLALSHYGLGDQSFNDMLYNGLIEAYRRFDIDIFLRIPEDDSEETFAAFFDDMLHKDGCNVVIAGEGFQMGPTVARLARGYPEVIFIAFEYEYNGDALPNLITVEFAQNEGSFVAGYLAARFSQSGRVGFLGGVDIPVIKDFESGFRQGLRYGDPACILLTSFISHLPDFTGFSDPARGNLLAKNLFERGADIVYSVAGASGTGIIQAARENGRYAIGVDSDQDYHAPGQVLTSMMKRLDIAILRLIEYRVIGTLRGGSYRFDYKNGGVSLTPMEYTKEKISASLIEDVRRVEEMIKDGQIAVVNTLRK